MDCEKCGGTCEFYDTHWAKYGAADCEEIVSVFKCINCGEEYDERDEDNIKQDYGYQKPYDED